jgi:low temperature requirement protein LtrA
VFALVLAFLGSATLWWLYFDATAENSRADIVASAQAGRLARDAYSYLHIPIVAGIIAVAVGDNLLLAHPGRPLTGVGAATALGGPALFLLGESAFRVRMIGSVALRRLGSVAALGLTALLSADISASALVAIVTAMLVVLALSERYAPGPPPARPAARPGGGPPPPSP